MKNWKIPSLILCLLILAMAFRWSTIATNTSDRTITKFQRDNWNGAVYAEKMNARYESYGKTMVQYPAWGYTSSLLTQTWGAALGADIIWLIWALIPKNKREKDNAKIEEVGKD